MDNNNVTNKINNMSEQEKKLEKRAKLVVSIPVIILVVTMIFLSSCSSTSHCQGFVWGASNTCPAYRQNG